MFKVDTYFALLHGNNLDEWLTLLTNLLYIVADLFRVTCGAQ